MNKLQIVSAVHDLIHESADGKGMVGSLLPGGWEREKLFRCFTTAYWERMIDPEDDLNGLTGDYLFDGIVELHPEVKGDQDSREFRLLSDVIVWWNEWRYAFDHYAKPY